MRFTAPPSSCGLLHSLQDSIRTAFAGAERELLKRQHFEAQRSALGKSSHRIEVEASLGRFVVPAQFHHEFRMKSGVNYWDDQATLNEYRLLPARLNSRGQWNAQIPLAEFVSLENLLKANCSGHNVSFAQSARLTTKDGRAQHHYCLERVPVQARHVVNTPNLRPAQRPKQHPLQNDSILSPIAVQLRYEESIQKTIVESRFLTSPRKSASWDCRLNVRDENLSAAPFGTLLRESAFRERTSFTLPSVGCKVHLTKFTTVPLMRCKPYSLRRILDDGAFVHLIMTGCDIATKHMMGEMVFQAEVEAEEIDFRLANIQSAVYRLVAGLELVLNLASP